MNGGYAAEKRKKGKGGDVSIGMSRPGDAMGIIWSQKTLKLERKPCDRTGKGPRRTFRRAALALAASLALTSVLPPPPAYSGGDEVHLVNDLAGRKDRYRANASGGSLPAGARALPPATGSDLAASMTALRFTAAHEGLMRAPASFGSIFMRPATAGSLRRRLEMPARLLSAEDPYDFGQYITGADFCGYTSGEAQLTQDYLDGAFLRGVVRYHLPIGLITQWNREIHYTLPDGIRPQGMTGIPVRQGDTVVGTADIAEDGRVVILFDASFATGNAIVGTMEFSGTVSLEDAPEDGAVHFAGDGGTIRIHPRPADTVSYDLFLEKNGSFIDGDTAEYEVTIRASNGTGGEPVRFTDAFRGTYTVNGGSITYGEPDVTCISRTGSVSAIEAEAEFAEAGEGEDAGLPYMTMTLPAMEEQSAYVIRYRVETEGADAAAEAVLYNTARASAGEWSYEGSSVARRKAEGAFARKTGSFENGMITWTVYISTQDGAYRDFSGVVVRDSMIPEGEIELGGSQEYAGEYVWQTIPMSDGYIDGDGFRYAFAGNESLLETLRQQGAGVKEVFLRYRTYGPCRGGHVANSARVETPAGTTESAEAAVDIPEQEDAGVWKREAGSDTVPAGGDGEAAVIRHRWEVTVQTGLDGTIWLEDEILDAVAEDGTTDLGPDSHYALAGELRDEILPALLPAEAVLRCYGADGEEIGPDDRTTPVKRFVLTADHPAGAGASLAYHTRSAYDALPAGETAVIRNGGRSRGGADTAERRFFRKKRIEKQVFKRMPTIWNRENGTYGERETIGPGNLVICERDGKSLLPFRIRIDRDGLADGVLTVTDRIPKGMRLHEEYHTSRGIAVSSTAGRASLLGVTVGDSGDGGQLVTFRIDGSGGGFCDISYCAEVGESFFGTSYGEVLTYTNTASFRGEEAVSVVTTTQEGLAAEKTGGQVGKDGGVWLSQPGLQGDGFVRDPVELTPDLRYAVVINPMGFDLLPGGEELTVRDTVRSQSAYGYRMDNCRVHLVPDSIEVHYLETEAYHYGMFVGELLERALGGPLNPDLWDVKEIRQPSEYEAGFTVTVPDGIPLVLTYRYRGIPEQDDMVTRSGDLANAFAIDGICQGTLNLPVRTDSREFSADQAALTIVKTEEGNLGHRLTGAEFALDRYSPGEGWVTERENLPAGDGGTLRIDMYDPERPVSADALYRIRETAVPKGFAAPDADWFFVWKGSPWETDEAARSCLLGVSPADLGLPGDVGAEAMAERVTLLGHEDGGTMYLTNRPSTLKIKKIWLDREGKETEAPEGIDEITVLLRRRPAGDASPSGGAADAAAGISEIRLSRSEGWEKEIEAPDPDAAFEIAELSVPKGWQVSYRGSGNAAGTLLAVNRRTPSEVRMPRTGGAGTAPVRAAGAVLLLAAAGAAMCCFLRRPAL